MKLSFGEIPDKKNAHVYGLLGVLVGKIETGSHPLKIGISGYIGKTTLAKNFSAFFGAENCIVIETDDYMRPRAYRRLRGLTGATPEGIDLDKAKRNLSDLLEGKTIRKPVYDHSTGKVLPDVEVAPRRIIIVAGNSPYYPELGVVYDIGYFIQVPEESKKWAAGKRAGRSAGERGYDEAAARIWEEKVLEDYYRFVAPHAAKADLVYEISKSRKLRLMRKSPRVEQLLNSRK